MSVYEAYISNANTQADVSTIDGVMQQTARAEAILVEYSRRCELAAALTEQNEVIKR